MDRRRPAFRRERTTSSWEDAATAQPLPGKYHCGRHHRQRIRSADQLVRFGTSWTIASVPIDLSQANPGDFIDFSLVPQTPAWGTTITSMDVEFVGIQPNAAQPTNFSPCSYQFFVPLPPICSRGLLHFDSGSPTTFSLDMTAPGADFYVINGPGYQWTTDRDSDGG